MMLNGCRATVRNVVRLPRDREGEMPLLKGSVSEADMASVQQESTASGSHSQATSSSAKSYGRVRQALLRLASSDQLCKFFCKGTQCKYCNPSLLPDEMKTIAGMYSSWVTDEILAFARPSAGAVELSEIIIKLREAGVKAVFNLQLPFEHRHCGQPLTEHGFSYDPEQFMELGVAHYNFGWPDFGTVSVERILNIVKVMQHSLEAGGKIAVHCHAGLGRTGMIIACFLIWTKGWGPNESLDFVRQRRPGSVQTPAQQSQVVSFHAFVESLRPVFDSSLDYDGHLKRQALILGGLEARTLKSLPKIILITVEMLLEIYNLRPKGHVAKYLREKNAAAYVVGSSGHLTSDSNNSNVGQPTDDVDHYADPFDFNNIVSLMCKEEERYAEAVEPMKVALNQGHFDERWSDVAKATNPLHQLALLGGWLRSLREPLIDRTACSAIAACDLLTGRPALLANVDGPVSSGRLTALSYLCHCFDELSRARGAAPVDQVCQLLGRWLSQDNCKGEAFDMLTKIFNVIRSSPNV